MEHGDIIASSGNGFAHTLFRAITGDTNIYHVCIALDSMHYAEVTTTTKNAVRVGLLSDIPSRRPNAWLFKLSPEARLKVDKDKILRYCNDMHARNAEYSYVEAAGSIVPNAVLRRLARGNGAKEAPQLFCTELVIEALQVASDYSLFSSVDPENARSCDILRARIFQEKSLFNIPILAGTQIPYVPFEFNSVQMFIPD